MNYWTLRHRRQQTSRYGGPWRSLSKIHGCGILHEKRLQRSAENIAEMAGWGARNIPGMSLWIPSLDRPSLSPCTEQTATTKSGNIVRQLTFNLASIGSWEHRVSIWTNPLCYELLRSLTAITRTALHLALLLGPWTRRVEQEFTVSLEVSWRRWSSRITDHSSLSVGVRVRVRACARVFVYRNVCVVYIVPLLSITVCK